MPRFVDFSMGIQAASPAEAKPVNQKLGAFAQALRWWLATGRVDAPFVKLYVDINEAARGEAGGLAIHENVAIVRVPVPRSTILAAGESTVRVIAAEATTTALHQLEEHTAWRDERVIQAVEKLARHQGPFQIIVERLAVVEREGKTRYVPILEVDESGARLRVEAYGGRDSLVGSAAVELRSPLELDIVLTAAKAKLIESGVQYVRRDGRVVATAPRPDAIG